MSIKRETLKNGMVLKALIERFGNDRTKQNLIPVLHCLRDSFVWIPGTMRVSDTDAEKFLNSHAGDTVTTSDVMRFEPDILINGEDKFYPVFSSIEEMGEYGNSFSKIEKTFFEAMLNANGRPETIGIVVNAFSTPFVVPKEWFDIVGSFPTNIVED